MAIPSELSDVLAGPLEGVTRIVVRHERRSRFRWLSLIELVLWLIFVIVLLACLLVFVVLSFFGDGPSGAGGDGFDLPWKVRFYHRWHELVIRCLDKDGAVVNELSHAPADAAEGHGVLASVLAAADRAGLVVVETLGGGVSETLEVYYGGQPLLAHPELRGEDEATGALRDAGYTVERAGGEARIARQGKATNRILAAFVFGVELLVFPFLFWLPAWWRQAKGTLLDLRGVPPEFWTLTVHADRKLTVRTERDGVEGVLHTVDARDLLSVTYAASLGYDKQVSRKAPAVRLVERDHAFKVPVEGGPRTCRAFRDLLLLLASELWEGIPSTLTRPTRCPYCGTVYVFAAEQSCPSCGASPGALA